MNDTIISIVPIAVAIVVVGLLLVLLCLSIIDLMSTRRTPGRKRHAPPYITVIVLTKGDSDATNECLKSIQSSSYRKVDVVVVNNAGGRDNPRGFKKLLKLGARMVYYKPRKKHTYDRLIAEAYKRSSKGGIVTVIDSHMTFAHTTLARVASQHGDIASGRMTKLQYGVDAQGLVGVVLSLKNSADRVWMRIQAPITLPEATMNTNAAYILSSGAVASKGRMISKWLGVFLLITAVIPLISGAIGGDAIEAFTMSWLLVALASVSLILLDTHTSVRQKIEASVCFGFMPIIAFIAFTAATRQLVPSNRI